MCTCVALTPLHTYLLFWRFGAVIRMCTCVALTPLKPGQYWYLIITGFTTETVPNFEVSSPTLLPSHNGYV
jgi:hypothetical protein